MISGLELVAVRMTRMAVGYPNIVHKEALRKVID